MPDDITDALRVLCLNVGSSSLKCALFALGEQETALATGAVEGIGGPSARLWLHAGDRKHDASGQFADAQAALQGLIAALRDARLPTPQVIGHRLVHGGPDLYAPCFLDDAVMKQLRDLSSFAPLHLPPELKGVDAARVAYPDLPQVGCFDTAFHRDLPELAWRLPLPRALADQGIRRYGFHGLSYEYVVQLLGDKAHGRVIIAHVGSGVSMVALRDAKPIDTTMGFSPSGGVMMGTRTGDLDPGVLLHLLRTQYKSAEQLEKLVNQESGLRGVSGTSNDVKTLLAASSSDPDARAALALFCYGLQKQIGAYAAALGGLDRLIFTGGIGEHAASIRNDVCRNLEYLGIRIDSVANQANADVISTAEAGCEVRVVETDEDRMIARHVRDLMQAKAN
jgi:acetate kinase